MEADIAPYREDGSVETVTTNLTGAKYTLAVPAHTYEAGLQSFEDIAKFSDEFSMARSTASSPAMDGNRLILDMIEADQFGLSDFETPSRARRPACCRP